jgi:cysteine desulfurase
VIQPISAIAAAVKAINPRVLVHTDAAQAVGKIPLDVRELGADLVSLSAHKLYGPKGFGALWVRSRPRVRVAAQILGGGHERGMRSGTLNVPAIVGFGKACELAGNVLAAEAARISGLRDRLERGLLAALPAVRVNGTPERRLPGNLNMSFGYVEGEALLMALRGLAVSSGSACTSATLEPSYVLRAIGVDDELAHASLRFGVGRFNTEAEIDAAIEMTTAAVTRLRTLSPAWRERAAAERTL